MQDELDHLKISELIQKATKLLSIGIERKVSRKYQKSFNSLVDSYKTDGDLRLIFDELTKGLNLIILDVNYTGIYLQPQPNSIFSIYSSDISYLTKNDSAKYSLLTFLGLAAFLYPDEAAFSRDMYSSIFFNEPDIILMLNDVCHSIIEKKKPEDVEIGNEDMELIAQEYLNLKSESKSNSQEKNTKEYYIRRALRFLVKQDFLKKHKSEKSIKYEVLPIMFLQMENLVQDPELFEFCNIFKRNQGEN